MSGTSVESPAASQVRADDLQEGGMQTFFGKVMRQPVVAVGLVGCFAVVGYSLWNVRRRPAGSALSMYLVQTRVAAQSVAVGSVLLLVLNKAYQDWKEARSSH